MKFLDWKSNVRNPTSQTAWACTVCQRALLNSRAFSPLTEDATEGVTATQQRNQHRQSSNISHTNHDASVGIGHHGHCEPLTPSSKPSTLPLRTSTLPQNGTGLGLRISTHCCAPATPPPPPPRPLWLRSFVVEAPDLEGGVAGGGTPLGREGGGR